MKSRVMWVAVAVAALGCSSVYADTHSLLPTTTDQYFRNAFAWSPNGVPANGDFVIMTHNFVDPIVVMTDPFPATPGVAMPSSLASLTMGGTNGGTITFGTFLSTPLAIDQVTLNAGGILESNQISIGTLTQNGGTIRGSTVSVANVYGGTFNGGATESTNIFGTVTGAGSKLSKNYLIASSASLSIAGGAFNGPTQVDVYGNVSLTSGTLSIGGASSGVAKMTQHSGDMTIPGTNGLVMIVDNRINDSANPAVYTMKGGMLTIAEGGLSVGAIKYGRVNQEDGQIAARALLVGRQSQVSNYGTGDYYLTGGTLTISEDTTLSFRGGHGSFYQSGGTHTTSLLRVGHVDTDPRFLTGTGLYEMSNGTLNAATVVIANGVGQTPSVLTRTGGTFEFDSITLLNGGAYAGLPLTLGAGQSLSGTGLIDANLVNGGEVRPGNSPGVLEVSGDFTQTADGTTYFELASSSVYDSIHCEGDSILEGTFSIALLGGFAPAFGESFGLIFADSITDQGFVIESPSGYQFDSRILTLSDGSQVLQVSVVPEPLSLSILGCGLIALLSRRRPV